jgi:hypothetical protein
MANFTERKWKYLSITLSVIVAAMVLAPQANAARPEHGDIVAAIQAAVTTIQNSISTSATETQTSVLEAIANSASETQTNIQDAIANSATETETSVGTVHAISLNDISIDPNPGQSQSLYVFGEVGGASNSGQITFNLSGPLGSGANEFTITCDVSDSGGVEFVFTEEGAHTQDFTCTLFNIIVYDNGEEPGVGPVTVNGLLQYTTAEDVSTISVDIPSQ